MGKLVEIAVFVEEMAFIPVMRVIKALPGVANLDWDLDKLDAPRGGPRGPRKANGHAPGEVTPGIRRLLVEALFEKGPLPRKPMADMIAAAGFAAASINSALHELQKGGIVENRDNLWHLTKDAEAKMREARQQPAPQLPPPAKRANKAAFKMPEYVHAVMQKANRPITAAEAKQAIVRPGFSPSGVWAVLQAMREDGIIKTIKADEKTFYELTAAGKKAKLPAELMKE